MKKIIATVILALGIGLPGLSAANPAVEAMLAQVSQDIDAAPKGSEALKNFTKVTLIPLCVTQELVDAAKASNAKGRSLSEIQEIDRQWREAEEELPIMAELLTNPCGKALQAMANRTPAMAKGFAFDNQGATVGSHRTPNDFWQGDEGKYRRTVTDHSIEIGPIKFDKAENTQLQHVALPLIDEDGSVVGGVLIGVFLDKL